MGSYALKWWNIFKKALEKTSPIMSRYKEKQIITIKNAFKQSRKINDQIFKKETMTLIKLHLLYLYFL